MKAIIKNLKASEGMLKTRGKEDKFEGGYRDIIVGINNTLDAVNAPVLEIQEVFKGDYAELKNALNNTIDTLHSYIEEIACLKNIWVTLHISMKPWTPLLYR